MFAVVKTGGKQYKVRENDLIRVEKLNSAEGESIHIPEILMISSGDQVHVSPANAIVKATVVRQFRDEKVIIFKKKRRHNYRRKKGHRQHLTLLKIDSVSFA